VDIQSYTPGYAYHWRRRYISRDKIIRKVIRLRGEPFVFLTYKKLKHLEVAWNIMESLFLYRTLFLL
jgi:hypothetical protein